MRLWIGFVNSLASVVRMVQLSTGSLSGVSRQRSHSPANAKSLPPGSRI
jgi:hypothetical protein